MKVQNFHFKFIFFKILMIFLSYHSVYAQIRPLEVGDTLPNVLSTIINAESETVSLSQFEGKSLIIDFWAPWCVPCVKSFPKIDSINKHYANDLTILPATISNKANSKNILSRVQNATSIKLKSIVQDTLLVKYFPHSSYPYQIWIDKNGVIKGMTSNDVLTESNIELLIGDKPLHFPEKESETERKNPDLSVPLFTFSNQSLNKSEGTSYEIITRFIPGLYSMIGQYKDRLSFSNVPALILYKIAYSEGNDVTNSLATFSVDLVTPDSLLYTQGTNWTDDEYKKWIYKNTYSCEISVPLKDSATKKERLRKLLNSYFPLKVIPKIESKNCLVLKNAVSSPSYATKLNESSKEENPYYLKYQNIPINHLISFLNVIYQYEHLPVLNETNYKGKIDLELVGDLKDLSAINKELKKKGLVLEVAKRDFRKIIIDDKE